VGVLLKVVGVGVSCDDEWWVCDYCCFVWIVFVFLYLCCLFCVWFLVGSCLVYYCVRGICGLVGCIMMLYVYFI
jgi:hypothetical protein